MLDRLLGGDTDIVIAGDSMMRQLYVRLLQLLRGRRRVFDYRVRSPRSPNVAHGAPNCCTYADA